MSEVCQSILDVGCGEGESLLDAHLPAPAVGVGIDINLPRLQAARRNITGPHFAAALGEQLPFGDGCFDGYISRVAWPCMDIPVAAREASRVLKKPGGRLWVKVHSFGFVGRHLLASLGTLNLRDGAYRIYVVVNGILFHLTGRMFRYPLSRRRCESFQTRRSIERALRKAGFSNIEVSQGAAFIVTATTATGSKTPSLAM